MICRTVSPLQNNTFKVQTGNVSSYPTFGKQTKLCAQILSCTLYTGQGRCLVHCCMGRML